MVKPAGTVEITKMKVIRTGMFGLKYYLCNTRLWTDNGMYYHPRFVIALDSNDIADILEMDEWTVAEGKAVVRETAENFLAAYVPNGPFTAETLKPLFDACRDTINSYNAIVTGRRAA